MAKNIVEYKEENHYLETENEALRKELVELKEKLSAALKELGRDEEAEKYSLTLKEQASKVAHITNEDQLAKAKGDERLKHDIRNAVALFDANRRKLVPGFIRSEYRNMDGEYLLRKHILETGRTPDMFINAINWLFSDNPKASFHRDYIMNIGKLIEKFNTLEHQSMHSKEAVEYTEEAKAFVNVLRKKGYTDEQIIRELRENGYVK